MPHTEDRRVRMTKAAIRNSFIKRMAQQPIAKISVKSICEDAGINRSTFYAHYRDQYDLLRKVQQEVVAEIREYIAGKTFTDDAAVTVPVLTQVLEYARENAALFQVLLNEDGDMTFQNDLMVIAQDQMLKEIRTDSNLSPQTAKYLQRFAISGIMSVVEAWVENGTPEEPEQLAETITKLLFQGMPAFYR